MKTRTAQFWIALFSCVVFLACDDEEQPETLNADVPFTDTVPDEVSRGDEGLPCEGTYVKSCSVDLPDHNGVTSCFRGVRECKRGTWGPCVDPETVDAERPEQSPSAGEGDDEASVGTVVDE